MGGRGGLAENGESPPDYNEKRGNNHQNGKLREERGGGVRGGKCKNGMKYPLFTVPFAPFFRRSQTFPFQNNQVRVLDNGKMGNVSTL